MEKFDFLQQPKNRREVLKDIGKVGVALGAFSIGMLPKDEALAQTHTYKNELRDKEQPPKQITEAIDKKEKDPALKDPVAQIVLEEANKLAEGQFAFDEFGKAEKGAQQSTIQ